MQSPLALQYTEFNTSALQMAHQRFPGRPVPRVRCLSRQARWIWALFLLCPGPGPTKITRVLADVCLICSSKLPVSFTISPGNLLRCLIILSDRKTPFLRSETCYSRPALFGCGKKVLVTLFKIKIYIYLLSYAWP